MDSEVRVPKSKRRLGELKEIRYFLVLSSLIALLAGSQSSTLATFGCTVLDNPRVLLHVFQRYSLVGIKNK